MAYSNAGLYQVGPGGVSPRLWVYSTTDTIATVTAADYFTDAFFHGLSSGDMISMVDTTNYRTTSLVVTTVTTGGAATAGQNNVSQELTASGAVVSGVGSIELNHATVVVASTIASSQDHEGLFMVVDTSASGTAAHTCTLTAGTWNGTATIVTLDAPKEAIIVWFDSAGNGTIVENVGSVALS